MGKPGIKFEDGSPILSVDTTTPMGSIALLKDASLVAEINHDSPVTYSERLLPSIRFLLETTGLRIQEVGGYAVAMGPGSFTGIRIGLSTVKSFAFASGKPIAPVSTLKALAKKIQHPKNRLVCPLLDAKKNEVYAALFESRSSGLHTLIPQGAYTPHALFSRLPAHRIIHFIGNGAAAYRSLLYQYFKDKARIPDRSPFIAFEVGQIGYEMLRNNQGKTADEISPLYLRKSQAEEKH
jgi:tRNA threonylcarbamoyladenosine biosynthesis protein TsaB